MGKELLDRSGFAARPTSCRTTQTRSCGEATRLLDAREPTQRARLEQLTADGEPAVQLAARTELTR